MKNIKYFFIAVFVFNLSSMQSFAQTGQWNTVAPMPTARGGTGAGVVDNGGVYNIYVAGGYDASGFGVKILQAYNPATNTWSTKAPMTVARYNLAGEVLNNIFYSIGGQSFDDKGWIEAFDLASNTWATKADMPTGRYGLAAATVNGVVYAIGGSPNHQLDYLEEQIFYSKVEAYNPTNNTWTSKADMPTGRFLLGAVAVNGIIYAIGGYNATSTLATVEAFDPATNTWSTKAPMNTARYGMYVGVVNGKIYVAGGSDINSLTATSSVESYDPVTNTWSLETSMPTAKAFGVGAAVDGVLYTIGASTTSGLAIPNSLVQAYTPAQATSVEVLSTNIPSFFTLEQNYPNPFNPSTTLRYSLPQSAQVQIKVSDVLGNEIETLVNEEKPVGTYELSWNAANLPSGVYFYRLQAGDFVQTRKMILLK